MKTESLIRVLAADAARPVIGIRAQVSAAIAGGAALSFVLFRLLFHPRPDFVEAINAHAFLLKIAVVAILAITAGGLLPKVARPLPVQTLRRIGLAPFLLAVLVIAEIAVAPPDEWLSRAMGRNALHCLGAIPLLSLPPALCLFVALRHGAPASASLAGAMAGLAAGGIGAILYAVTCPDDSPLFVALWYSLAIGAVTMLGSLAGRRWLRW